MMMMMITTHSTMVIDTRTQINLYFTRSKLLNNDLNHLKTNTLGISFETHRPLEIRVDDGRISSKIEFWGKRGWNWKTHILSSFIYPTNPKSTSPAHSIHGILEKNGTIWNQMQWIPWLSISSQINLGIKTTQPKKKSPKQNLHNSTHQQLIEQQRSEIQTLGEKGTNKSKQIQNSSQ